MDQRYITNNLPAQTLGNTPDELLKSSLRSILDSTPPLDHYTTRQSGGLFSGYTGLAWLFLQLSATYQDLKIHDHSLRHWAGKYLDGRRPEMVAKGGNCGLSCERLSYHAVQACYTSRKEDLIEFLSCIPLLLGSYPSSTGDPFSCELIYGRAGALYLLRAVGKWMPDHRDLLESPTQRLIDTILSSNENGRPNWKWHGKRYIGAAHGEIGILTQVVLADYASAGRVIPHLQRLLELQNDNGNWPSSEEKLNEGRPAKLVQWCHGAPGFIHSLRVLRPHFPTLHAEIDRALVKAQDIVKRQGILTKEPSLCHGIFGNALALPKGSDREHFLSLATVEAVGEARRHDPQLFVPASSDKDWATLTSYHTSAAWTWAYMNEDHPPFMMYSDV